MRARFKVAVPVNPPSPTSLDTYTRHGRLVRVVDGDTVDLDVDLGWKLRQIVRFRLLGVDTPELRSSDLEERRDAQEAKAFVFHTLSVWSEMGSGADLEFPLWVISHKTGKYGRWLGTIGSRDPVELESLNQLLLSSGLARPYLS